MTRPEYRVIPEAERGHLSKVMQFAFAPDEYPKKPSDSSPVPQLEEPRGAYLNDELVATALLYSFDSHVRGRPIVLNGIGGVASPPEFRHHGYVRGLLGDVLDELRSRDIPLSALFPFSFPFYRRLGWQLGGNLLRYKLRTSYLADFQDDADRYTFRPVTLDANEQDLAPLQAVYDRWAGNYDLTVGRSSDWWQKRSLNRWGNPPIVYVAHNEQGVAEGYVLYRIKDHGDWKRTLQAVEMAWTTLAAYRALLGFLYRHDSQAQAVTLFVPPDDLLLALLDDPRIESTEVVPNHMLRVVSVDRALVATHAPEVEDWPRGAAQSLTLEVDDELAPWNNGLFVVQVERNRGAMDLSCASTQRQTRADVSLPVQALAQLVGGFLGAHGLFALGKLQLHRGDAEALRLLDTAWPAGVPFHNELY